MNVLEKSSHLARLKLFVMLCSQTSVQSFKIVRDDSSPLLLEHTQEY